MKAVVFWVLAFSTLSLAVAGEDAYLTLFFGLVTGLLAWKWWFGDPRRAKMLILDDLVKASQAITADELDALGTSSDSTVRMQVALNPNTPIARLDALANDADHDVAHEARTRLKMRGTD